MSLQDDYLAAAAALQARRADASARFLELIAHACGLDEIEAFCRSNRADLVNGFVAIPAAQKALNSFNAGCPQIPPDPDASPTFLLNVASLLVVLDYELPKALANGRAQLEQAIDRALRLLAERWVRSCSHQIDSLVLLIREVVHFVGQLAGKVRVALLELPVGNSIPTRLLAAALGHANVPFDELRASLSRNDSRKHGITRDALLKECFDGWGLRANDIVLYIDEWLTGSNFKNLIKKLDAITAARGAFLVPAAALAHDADEKEHYESCRAEHERILAKLGTRGDAFRVRFPILNPGTVKCDQTFFWSESDRLAGYRKMQHLGAILSSIFEVVDELRSDEAKLRATHARLMEVIAQRQLADDKTFGMLASGFKAFREVFESGFPDFQAWKEEVIKIDFPTNDGDADDADVSLRKLSELISDTAEGRPAKKCILPATIWIKMAEIDPRDQYYIRGHVPVIAELSEGLEKLNRVFYERLQSRVIPRVV